MRNGFLAAVAAFAIAVCPLRPAGAQDNVLLILADDLGVDMVGCYALGSDLAPTPNIDALAAQGVRFERAWSNPLCSPTRATILTGRYSFRTQIGTIVGPVAPELSPAELALPRMLDIASPHGYAHAAIGKWHLGALNGPATHPGDLGFGHFSGALGNFIAHQGESFFAWTKVVNGQAQPTTSYATTEAVDDALAWIGQTPEPWFCYLAFNAPHDPWHHPPPHLFTVQVPNVDPRFAPRPFYKAAVEAMDTEIGRLLSSLDPALRARTTVIFLGDNGTPKQVTVPPFDPTKAKLTVYEGGVRVPLIVSGPAVVAPGRTCDALVNTTDLFATVLALAGVGDLSNHPVPHDSVNLMPLLTQAGCAPLREVVYAEAFVPNGGGPYEQQARTVRDVRYKLIRRGLDASQDELYDLLLDPWETQNLLRPPSAGPASVRVPLAPYLSLDQRLTALLASQP